MLTTSYVTEIAKSFICLRLRADAYTVQMCRSQFTALITHLCLLPQGLRGYGKQGDLGVNPDFVLPGSATWDQ